MNLFYFFICNKVNVISFFTIVYKKLTVNKLHAFESKLIILVIIFQKYIIISQLF